VEVAGAEQGTFEASILGNGGREYGMALYQEKGALQKLTRLVDEGRMQEALLDSIVVTFHEKPAFAIHALEEALGLSRVPVPLRMKGGALQPFELGELVAVTGALRAASALKPRVRVVEAEAGSAAVQVTVRVSAPLPEGFARKAARGG